MSPICGSPSTTPTLLASRIIFRFAPRIRDLADKRLYVPGKASQWASLSALIGGSIRGKLIEQQFAEVLRLGASIQQGTVTASLLLRKLGVFSLE